MYPNSGTTLLAGYVKQAQDIAKLTRRWYAWLIISHPSYACNDRFKLGETNTNSVEFTLRDLLAHLHGDAPNLLEMHVCLSQPAYIYSACKLLSCLMIDDYRSVYQRIFQWGKAVYFITGIVCFLCHMGTTENISV